MTDHKNETEREFLNTLHRQYSNCHNVDCVVCNTRTKMTEKSKKIPEHECKATYHIPGNFSYCQTCSKPVCFNYQCDLCKVYLKTSEINNKDIVAAYAFMRENPHCDPCKALINQYPVLIPWMLKILKDKMTQQMQDHEDSSLHKIGDY